MTQRYFLFAGIILCAFIAAILSHIAFHHANEPAEQNISCNAHVINFTDHTKMDQYFSLNMISENNTGNMYLTGAYTVDGKKIGFIRRYVSFTYKKFRDTVYFTTVKITKNKNATIKNSHQSAAFQCLPYHFLVMLPTY